MNNLDLHCLTRYNLKRNVARSPLSTQLKNLVLETDPTPDYYARNNFPPNKRDRNMHLYIPVKQHVNNFQEIVLTNICLLNKKYETNFYVNPGHMIFQKNNYQCIRIKETTAETLQIIIDEFKKLGFSFFKDTKVKIFESSIFYNQYTEFLEIEDGVYQDKGNESKYFFTISNHVDLDEFLSRIKNIKNNCNYHLFDAFSAYMFVKDSMQCFAGICSENCDKARFGELKQHLENSFN